MKNEGVWTELEIKIWLLRESWRKGWRQIDKIKKNRFFYEMVYS